MSNTEWSWRLVSQDGCQIHKLPSSMIFLGRETCDITLQSNSVDKRHAVISFDHLLHRYKIKDLGSLNGTYVNDRRIPEETYEPMEDGDSLRLGYDPHASYRVERYDSTSPKPQRHSLTASKSLDDSLQSSSGRFDSLDQSPSGSERERSGSGDRSRLDRERSVSGEPSRSSSRPRWDQRPILAECQGCIREQSLQHTCGSNSEVASSNVSQDSLAHSHSDRHPYSERHIESLHDNPHIHSTPHQHNVTRTSRISPSVEAHMPEDPIVMTHVPKARRTLPASQSYSTSREAPTRDVPDANFLPPSAVIKGTPLYGQPSWWGESDADEHNKQILLDIQKRREVERLGKSGVSTNGQGQESSPGDLQAQERSRSPVDSSGRQTPAGSPPQKLNEERSSPQRVEGETGAASLSFVIQLSEFPSPGDTEQVVEDAEIGNKAKLSNFLPENLRKSFRQRQQKLAADKVQVVSKTDENSGPTEGASNSKPVNTYLLDRLLESSGMAEEDDQATECSLYSETRKINRYTQLFKSYCRTTEMFYSDRSLTMPELAKQTDDEDKVSESGTYTIDEDNEELNKARADIDELFGVGVIVKEDTITNVDRSPDDYPTKQIVGGSPPTRDFDPTLEVLVNLDPPSKGVIDGQMEESLKVQAESDKTGDTYSILVETEERNSYPREDNSLDEIASVDTSALDRAIQRDGRIVTSKPPLSPPLSGPRARRRLPDVPPPHDDEKGPEEPGRSMGPPRRRTVESSKEKILQGLGIGDGPVMQKERPKLVEELLTSRTYHSEDDPIVLNKTAFFDKIVSTSMHETVTPILSNTTPTRSERKVFQPVRNSTDSINTEVLLQSTDEFMKAVHSFSDAKSTTSAGTNQNSGSKKLANQTSSSTRLAYQNGGASKIGRPAATKKDPVRKSVADSVTERLTGAKRASATANDSYRSSSDSLSSQSSNKPGPGRTNQVQAKTTPSKPLTNTRPNRTFELRRARTEDIESNTSSTPRRGVSASRGSRSNSMERSEISLGMKIVAKSRENTAADSKTSSIRRTDGGRYSMRVTEEQSKPKNAKSSKPSKGSAISTASSSSSSAPSKRKPGLPRQQSASSLRTGKETEKGKEKAAWDRRRTYDPRRAVAQAKAKKSESRGATPSSPDEPLPATPNTRPRANSYSGETTTDNMSTVVSIESDIPNKLSDTRHSADVFNPMESDRLKLQLPKEGSMDSSHELEIAKMSYELAKDLDILTKADHELTAERGAHLSNPETSPETEELVNSIFASGAKPPNREKSAFCSYRSLTSATPETSESPALSPMRKKLSSSQNLTNQSPSSVDQSYNNLVVHSIQQLASKLSSSTVDTVSRLRDKGVSVSISPSPTEELEHDMPASHELAIILKTLKRVEHNVKVMDKALFNSVPETELSTVRSNEHEHYLAEIKRIRNEIAGFRPIESNDKSDTPPKKVLPKVAAKPAAGKARVGTTSNGNKTNGVSTYKRSAYY